MITYWLFLINVSLLHKKKEFLSCISDPSSAYPYTAFYTIWTWIAHNNKITRRTRSIALNKY